MTSESPAEPKPAVGTSATSCVSLIGMAGAGKTTIGRLLADTLGFAHIDTDDIIQATFGESLQDVADHLGVDGFRKAEETIVTGLSVRRCVISTGGSVVYGQRAVDRLKALGPVIHLDPGLDEIECRVTNSDNRGLSRRPGQSLADLHHERAPLYAAAADLTLPTCGLSPAECVTRILAWLERNHPNLQSVR